MVTALRDTAGTRPPGGKVGSSYVEVKAASPFVATITVARTSTEDCGIREVFISVDGVQVGIGAARERLHRHR